MKNKILALGITILILLIIIIVFIISVLCNNNIFQFMFASKNSEKLSINEEYENDVELIEINSTAADIKINHTDADKIKVIVYGDSKYVNVDVKNSKLKIDINKKRWFRENIYKVVIHVPITYDKYFKIFNEYGDIDISSFVNSNFEVNLDYGNIYVDGANRVELTNKLGNVDLNKINISKIDVLVGNITVDTVNNIEISSDFGNIEIENLNDSINLESKCGNIKIENAKIKTASFIDSSLGDINIKYLDNVDVLTKKRIGNLDIKNDNDASKFKFIINSRIGNININK